jgi:hypothetical protein
MIWIELKKTLDPMNNGFGTCGGPKAKLERSEKP